MDHHKAAPGAVKAMRRLETYVHQRGIERPLTELVKVRASQINGCAYCIDMHTKNAWAWGESEQRLCTLDAWEVTPFFTENAALAWTEAVMRVAESRAPDDIYELVRQQLTEKELADLTLAIATINGWNRLAITSRALPGTYRPERA